MAAMYWSRHTLLSRGPHSLAMLGIMLRLSGVHRLALATQVETAVLRTPLSSEQLVATAVPALVGIATSWGGMCWFCMVAPGFCQLEPYWLVTKTRTALAPDLAMPDSESES